jgi:hypothetical protein
MQVSLTDKNVTHTSYVHANASYLVKTMAGSSRANAQLNIHDCGDFIAVIGTVSCNGVEKSVKKFYTTCPQWVKNAVEQGANYTRTHKLHFEKFLEVL